MQLLQVTTYQITTVHYGVCAKTGFMLCIEAGHTIGPSGGGYRGSSSWLVAHLFVLCLFSRVRTTTGKMNIDFFANRKPQFVGNMILDVTPQVASIRDMNATGRAGALYPGFQAVGCANCSTPGHICNQMGTASQSLEEMAFERGLW